jgi:hypothetical protein
MTKPVAIKRRTLLKVAILIVLVLCGYAGFQWNQHRLLTVRSHLVEEQLKRLLPRSGDSVSIENLLPSDSVGSEEVALVCTVTPYQFQYRYSELANLDFRWWFGFGGESWIGVVALDAEGDLVTTARLSRRKVDLRPFTEMGRCYHPKAANLVNVGSEEESILLTIEKR